MSPCSWWDFIEESNDNLLQLSMCPNVEQVVLQVALFDSNRHEPKPVTAQQLCSVSAAAKGRVV